VSNSVVVSIREKGEREREALRLGETRARVRRWVLAWQRRTLKERRRRRRSGRKMKWRGSREKERY